MNKTQLIDVADKADLSKAQAKAARIYPAAILSL